MISFCAARPGGPLAPGSTRRAAVNPKVGGILTTNYDNLVEGCFGSKYRIGLLKPMGRMPTRARTRGTIPVYHIHGYVSYVPPKDNPQGVKASDIVVAQEDYFKAFYNLQGFGNVVAMNFLRQFPCLFIGSGMTDRNIRRVLYQLREESVGPGVRHSHIAILEAKGESDEFESAVLRSYGVEVIRVSGFCEIPGILMDLYTSMKSVSNKEWEWVWKGP